MPKVSTTPRSLKPYTTHGLDLTVNSSGTQAIGDCPWCGKEGKFSVQVESGLWRCLSCDEGAPKNKPTATHGGNSWTFLRLLHARSLDQKHVFIEGRLQALAENRKIALSTLQTWGVAPSFLNHNDILIPGYGTNEKINQLYRSFVFTDSTGKRKLVVYATPQHGNSDPSNPDVFHTLFGLNPDLYDADKETIYLTEGCWDAMALWETLGKLKWTDGEGSELTVTSNREVSLLAAANVLAVPGCTTFRQQWLDIFAGKRVVLLYDNDHPREDNGKVVLGGGCRGMQGVARMLLGAKRPPAEISYLHWGDSGYNGELPSGYDVRDWLTTQMDKSLAQRASSLLTMVKTVPDDWKQGIRRNHGRGIMGLLSNRCMTWKELNNEWRKALYWYDSPRDCLAVLMAVCLSTDQVGDQLFLQLIGDAGSGKTELCEGLLASSYCHPVEKLTGFVSGWKGENGESCSLLDRINHKTLVTAEGDLLLSNPKFGEIMSEQRRIFDGSACASYKNRKDDLVYTGLRTPWIIAGTPALLNRKDVHLGDRFLRCFLEKPSSENREEIEQRAAYAMVRATLCISNGKVDNTMSSETRAARQATGGYVDYLREHVEELLNGVESPEWTIDRCIELARFTALLRSRSDPNPYSEMVSSESSTRLIKQFVRLARNLAAVLGRESVDKDVIRLVRKVALDTSKGLTLDICRFLYISGDDGREPLQMTNQFGLDWKRRLEPLMVFLHKIDVVEPFKESLAQGVRGKQRWRLTKGLRSLYREVIVATDE